MANRIKRDTRFFYVTKIDGDNRGCTFFCYRGEVFGGGSGWHGVDIDNGRHFQFPIEHLRNEKLSKLGEQFSDDYLNNIEAICRVNCLKFETSYHFMNHEVIHMNIRKVKDENDKYELTMDSLVVVRGALMEIYNCIEAMQFTLNYTNKLQEERLSYGSESC